MAGLRDLVSRARGGRLRSSELTDATITVTNLGDQGVESVLGMIYPPQVALVGFGKSWSAHGRSAGSSACGRSPIPPSPPTTGKPYVCGFPEPNGVHRDAECDRGCADPASRAACAPGAKSEYPVT
jgi:hypothetical protein